MLARSQIKTAALSSLSFATAAVLFACNPGPPPGDATDESLECSRRYHCLDKGDFVECEDGYEWEDPSNSDNFRCTRIDGGEGEGEGEGPPPPPPPGEGEGEGEGEGPPPPPPPPDDPPPTCGTTGSVTGSLTTSIANLTAESDATATVNVEHRLDVDASEDRCITEYQIDAQLHSLGCHLVMRFETDSDGIGALRDIEFSADSFCAGFSDAQEGTYYAYNDAPLWPNGDPGVVPDYQAPTSCIEATNLTFPNRTLTLQHDYSGATLDINLGGLAIYGSFNSDGFAVQGSGRTCRETVGCGVGRHDGGDGFCAYEGSCNEGFTLQYPGGDCGTCGAGDQVVDDVCVDESSLSSDMLNYPTSGLSFPVEVSGTTIEVIKFNATADDYMSFLLDDCTGDTSYVRPYLFAPDGSQIDLGYGYCGYHAFSSEWMEQSGEYSIYLMPEYDDLFEATATLTITPGS